MDMKNLKQGSLFNKAGNGRYMNSDAPEKLIRYITRTGMRKDDLIAWGGTGIAEFMDMDFITGQFALVRNLHSRSGNFGRYVDHEVYSFSVEEQEIIYEQKADVDRMARKMAYDFYERDHCQAVYAVHAPSKEKQHMHIHFAVNTVSFKTGNKRRENRIQTKEREKRFREIVCSEIR